MPEFASWRSRFEGKKYSVTTRWDRFLGKRFVHFFHIGKTGGTAVKHALIRHRPKHYHLVFTNNHRGKLSGLPQGEAAFFFVRDPLTRFVSGFNSRLREGRPRYYYPHTADEREAYSMFQTPNELALALSDSQFREDAERAMRAIQHVRDSLWYWLESKSVLTARWEDVLFVGSQEHLGRDFKELVQILGVDAALPTDEVSSHRNPAGMSKHLDPEATRNLRRWYARDYECLRLLRRRFPHLPEYDQPRQIMAKAGR